MGTHPHVAGEPRGDMLAPADQRLMRQLRGPGMIRPHAR